MFFIDYMMFLAFLIFKRISSAEDFTSASQISKYPTLPAGELYLPHSIGFIPIAWLHPMESPILKNHIPIPYAILSKGCTWHQIFHFYLLCIAI